MASKFEIAAIFKGVDKITAPVKRMQNSVGVFVHNTNKGLKSTIGTLDKVSGGLKRIGMVAAVAGGVMGGILANVIGAGMEFEQAITNVGAVSLKTRAQIVDLEKQAIHLGAVTKFTATQAANAQEILSRAGLETADILAATPAVLSAAAASGLEMAETADYVVKALKGMGMKTSESARVADVLTLASSRTNSTIGSLGESLSLTASTARELGVDIEETVSAVALLQDVGLDASVAGSAFNTMLTQMAKPTAGLIKQMEEWKISFKDLNGDMLPIEEVLNQLSIAGKKAGGNFDKVAFFAELVGLRGQKAATNLATLFESGKYSELTRELRGAKGAADEMARLRMDTLAGSFTLLTSAIDAVKIKMYSMNGGPLKEIVDRMTKWVTANEDLIATKIGDFLNKIINNFDKIVSWIKKIGIALAVFYTFITILKTLSLVLTVVNALMALNPAVWVALGIIALVAAVYLLIKHFDAVKAWFNGLPGWVKVAGAAIAFLVTGPIGQLVSIASLVIAAWDPIKEFFTGLWNTITKVTGMVAKAVGIGAPEVIGTIKDGRLVPKSEAQEPQVVSPQERIARSIEEKRTTTSSEVTINSRTGKAEVTKGKLGTGLKLIQSGAF